MKPKNFPARKLKRQMEAVWRMTGRDNYYSDFTDGEQRMLDQARQIRTKKDRGNK